MNKYDGLDAQEWSSTMQKTTSTMQKNEHIQRKGMIVCNSRCWYLSTWKRRSSTMHKNDHLLYNANEWPSSAMQKKIDLMQKNDRLQLTWMIFYMHKKIVDYAQEWSSTMHKNVQKWLSGHLQEWSSAMHKNDRLLCKRMILCHKNVSSVRVGPWSFWAGPASTRACVNNIPNTTVRMLHFQTIHDLWFRYV